MNKTIVERYIAIGVSSFASFFNDRQQPIVASIRKSHRNIYFLVSRKSSDYFQLIYVLSWPTIPHTVPVRPLLKMALLPPTPPLPQYTTCVSVARPTLTRMTSYAKLRSCLFRSNKANRISMCTTKGLPGPISLEATFVGIGSFSQPRQTTASQDARHYRHSRAEQLTRTGFPARPANREQSIGIARTPSWNSARVLQQCWME